MGTVSYELILNESSKLIVKCLKTEFCDEWCNIHLINKNKLDSEHKSFNNLYLGDTSKEKLINAFIEADKKIDLNNFPKCIKDDGIEYFRIITFEVEYSTIYMSLPPNKIIMIIYGNPDDLLGKIKIQFNKTDLSEWIKVAKVQ